MTKSLWAVLPAALLSAAFTGCNNLNARSLNAEGVRQHQMGRPREAMARFQEAIQQDPTDPDGYYNLAAGYHAVARQTRRREDFLQAENLYNQCLNREPNHVECHRALAVMLAEQNRKEEAYRLMERWLDRSPSSADAKVEMARLLEENGRTTDARDFLAKALELDPRNSRALTASAKIRDQKGDPQQALVLYQRSLDSNPNQPEVAARIAALRPAVNVPIVTPTTTPDDGARLAGRGTGTTLR